ncbi:MAG: alcohol dehydrogenase catalytic domain-containing protein [Acidimicrobiia bacterium]|nr:alcohol dehydrogenase catalytic domain-containing protein [Acidimicrobiia bacterium]MBT8191780.1 alcohol dehydrogenase catalytic domain-containing protein [Acidimicrobiia bacterium]NNL14754.1 alcohol dehydrogenase catalytic domain-containing protein [Acidimicrobiia bacterium]RZV43744.1 MAG: alcohol dehydrogenase [Acidimicrobiia bacterium]
MTTFRALRLVAQNQPLVETELAIPELAAGEALVSVQAAGICRSDVHYLQGSPKLPPLPRTLGHEVAGVVESLGPNPPAGIMEDLRVGVHYQTSCGTCRFCLAGNDQFCVSGQMVGNGRDGGYAEMIVVPARNLVAIPDGVAIEHAAVMMCSSATSYHALRKARLEPGERVAVFGLGGLGQSAAQLALALGASAVYAVDLNPAKAALAAHYGAIPIAGGEGAVDAILEDSGGVDVSLELVGLAETMRQAVGVLGPQGRAAAVGLAEEPFLIDAYEDLVLREAEIIGVSDHLASELPTLLDLAARGDLDLSRVVSNQVPLEAGPVNRALDDLVAFGDEVRTVIVPFPPEHP